MWGGYLEGVEVGECTPISLWNVLQGDGAGHIGIWGRDVECHGNDDGPTGGVPHQDCIPFGVSAQTLANHRRLGLPSVEGHARGSGPLSNVALHPETT
jgi:hypothetical protein